MHTALPGLWFADAAVVRRSREVARVLSGHGLGSLLDRSGLRRHLPLGVFGDGGHPASSQAVRVRLALGELGTTFIKLGQTLSTRADLLPADLVDELSKLQDSAPRVPVEHIRRVILDELHAGPDELLARFDDAPLASASIGQVHAARMHDGREVVLKVRRPGVEEQVEVDLQILAGIADWVEAHTEIGRDFRIRPLVDEFAFTIREELDYRREAAHARQFRLAFRDDPSVWIPRVIPALSTSRVLTLERVTGCKLSDVESLDGLGIDRRAVAETAVRLFLRQLLEFGFFHADAHPGNYFVQPDATMAIVDFGMVGRVPPTLRDRLLRAGLCAIRNDAAALAEELYELGVAGPRADRQGFERDLERLLRTHSGGSLGEWTATAVIRELSQVAFRHRLQLPGELALLFRVIVMSEGIGVRLDPGFQYVPFASPYLKARWRQSHGLLPTLERMGRAGLDAFELGVELPKRARWLLGRIERGELEFNVKHEGLTLFARQLQGMTNRLVLAVILAASVVALGLATGARVEPHAAYVGVLFRIGLVFSFVFGAIVLWTMWRARR